MEEIRLAWPNGGMGNTVYCLLHLCSKELFIEEYNNLDIITNGSPWHNIAGYIEKKTKNKNIVIFDHFGYDVPNRMLVGSSNRYFVKLLSWHKWEGIPDVLYGKKLELLVKYLNFFVPVGGLNVDFEILNFFENKEYVRNFIEKHNLTVNDNFEYIVDKIIKNNQIYYNEIITIESVVQDVLEKNDRKINLLPYQQAMVMSMLEIKLDKPFKLVYNSFTNTKDILNFLEN